MTANETDDGQTRQEEVISIVSQVLLFFLVLGFAATVDYRDFKDSIRSKGTVICLTMQFLVMPFVGFLHVVMFKDLKDVFIVSLMIMLSSPGGTYSNFFTSVFNGDLSLSVAMTTVSTFLSVITLPLNLLFYLGFLLSRRNNENVGDLIDWGILGQTVAIIISAISTGLFLNYKIPQYAGYFNGFANLCGVVLIFLGLFISNSDKPLWEQPFDAIFVSFSPPLLALIATVFVGLQANLEKPKIFALAIEVCLQNSSIAISFALLAFTGERQSDAIALPILYGAANAIYATLFAMYGFSRGWTYTPKGISVYKALIFSYQPGRNGVVEQTKFSVLEAAVNPPTVLTL